MKQKISREQEQKILYECIHENNCVEFVQQYYNLILYVTGKIYANIKGTYTDNEIEDRVQDVFVKLFEQDKKALRQFDSKKGKLSCFLVNIAMNSVKDYFKKKKEPLVWGNLESDENLGKYLKENDLEFNLQEIMTAKELRLFLKELKPPRGIVLDMMIFEGLNAKEVAEILKTTENNVNIIKHRAIKQLKRIVSLRPEIRKFAQVTEGC